jgi:hypothetical protein
VRRSWSGFFTIYGEAASVRQGLEPGIMLSDAELVLGVSRHLSAFVTGPARAALAQIEYAGQMFEMAWRLRGSGLSSARRVTAIGIEAGIGQRNLHRDILPGLESLGWVDLRKDHDGALAAVDEHVPPPPNLLGLAQAVLDIAVPTSVERAALVVLRETTVQPLVKGAALAAASTAVNEQAAEEALRHLRAVNLIRAIEADDGRLVLFNPNVWTSDPEVSRAALRTEDAKAKEEVGALIEEIGEYPGIPQDHVTSTDSRWIDFAVSLGLVQRSLVETTEGRQRSFLFTPHMARDPFGVAGRDSSGHVRQLVGSMIYAATFARYRLEVPATFVRRLIEDGEAGDASPIGTDYPMLETAGIVRVEAAARYYKLVLLQADVAEEALNHLEDRGTASRSGDHGLRAQRSYVHLERERARLAMSAPLDKADSSRLISALRDTVGRRDFRGR